MENKISVSLGLIECQGVTIRPGCTHKLTFFLNVEYFKMKFSVAYSK